MADNTPDDRDNQPRFDRMRLHPAPLAAETSGRPSELVDEATVFAHQSNTSPQTLTIQVEVPDGVVVRLSVNDADYEVHVGSDVVGLPLGAQISSQSTDLGQPHTSAPNAAADDFTVIEFVCEQGSHRQFVTIDNILDSGTPICVVEGCAGFDTELIPVRP